MSDLLIGGVNMATAHGFKLVARSGARGGPDHRTPTAGVVGGVPVATNDRPVVGVRSWAVSGIVYGSDAADVQERLDAIKTRARLSTEVELSFSDLTDRSWFGRFEQLIARPWASERPRDRIPVTIRFALVRPFAYSAEQTITGIGTSDTAIPLGAEKTRDLVLRIVGSATDPVVTLEDAAGDEIGALTLEATIASGDWLEADMAKGSIVDQDGANMGEVRSTDSLWPLILDPADCDPFASPADWLTLSCSSGTMRAKYRKAY